MNNSLPNGNTQTAEDLGNQVRAQRKQMGMTQADAAALCGVGTRFLSDLENGKPTVEIGKTLKVLHCLGLEVSVQLRHWPRV